MVLAVQYKFRLSKKRRLSKDDLLFFVRALCILASKFQIVTIVVPFRDSLFKDVHINIAILYPSIRMMNKLAKIAGCLES